MPTHSADPKFRALVVAALIVGAVYLPLVERFPVEPLMVPVKGLAVALLALWAALNARGLNGWLIAAVLALGALGDVMIDGVGLIAGAWAFLAGHVVAIFLYLRHRRARLTGSQIGCALALLIGAPVIAWLLPADRSIAPGAALYGFGVGAMAASAWISRFPRYQVGIGAVLFVISDMMIFARMGPLNGSIVPLLTIWPLYVLGQALIGWGVVTSLLRWRENDDLHHRL
jgi:uncharacterized membrane protein YhhN